MKANKNGESIDLEIQATLDTRQKTKTRRQNDIKTNAENSKDQQQGLHKKYPG